jgi:phage tail sheath protein FI
MTKMPEYLSPGVYVEEFEMGSKPIEGVSTSTAGMVGVTQRGPLNEPTLVTSFAEFTRVFGGHLDSGYGKYRYLPHAVEGFFQNGGQRVYITRIAVTTGNGAAAKSSLKLPDVSILTTTLSAAVSSGENALRLASVAAIAATVGDIIRISDGAISEFGEVTNVGGTVDIRPSLLNNHDKGAAVQKVELETTADATIRGGATAGQTDLALNITGSVSAGDIFIIADSDLARVEFCEIATVPADPATDPCTVVANLRFDHTQDIELKKVTSPAEDTSLVASASIGDTELQIQDTSFLVEGDVIKINDAGVEEYCQIAVKRTDAIIVTPPVQFPHRTGTSIEKMSPTILVKAESEGVWGDKVNIKTYDSTILKAKVKTGANVGDVSFELKTTSGIEAGTVLKLSAGGDYGVVSSVSGNRVFLTAGLPVNLSIDPEPDEVSTCEFRLVVSYDGEEEIFDKLSMDNAHSRFFERVINGSSRLVTVEKLTNATSPPDNRPLFLGKADPGWNLADGEDGVNGIKDETIIGVDDEEPAKRTGLQTLKNIDPISIVAIPNATSQEIQSAMIIHCELMKDRFAVLDPVEGFELAQIQEQRTLYDSKYAALYYPWIKVNDPYSEEALNVPPSGHICGIYARSDTERGVHKAPANELIRGALGLERAVVKGQQDILNPLGVNCLRVFPGRGIRVWGARTISSDTLWKYINVRRLFLFLEESIEDGTQWVVFEPNDQKLWARVRATITEFLTRVWKDGALMGSTPDEAFFVKCDETTMTQDDIENGRLICIIGVAPVKPAEFVIFRIAQWRGGSEVTE